MSQGDGSGLRVDLLGPLTAHRDGVEIRLGRGQVRALLAILALEPDRTVPFDRIVDRLWGGAPPSSARGTLHVYAMRLRRALGDDAFVRTGADGYALAVEPGAVDVHRFHGLTAQAREADDDATGFALLSEAAGLWRGPALTDVPALRGVAQRLDEERLQALEERVELGLRLGLHAELVTELGELTREHPLRERLWAASIRALAATGRQAEALGAYQRVRRLFHDELGIEPGEEVRQAHRAVLAGEPEPTVPFTVTPNQLPPDPRTFVGRTGQVDELTAELSEGGEMPVVVLSGPPGVGKTALALRVAHRLGPAYPDGRLYVNLQGYSPDAPLSPTVALARFLGALGVPANQMPADEAEQESLYRSLLATRRILVVLDNASGPEQVRPLLPGQPGCAALVTSRDHLRGLVALDGAHQLTLAPMSHDESRAVLAGMLGADRVAAAPDAVDDLVAACAQLPLALRIAAANLRANPHLSIADYARTLRDKGRLRRLRVQGDARAAVRAAFDLSHDRLDPAAARLFRLLGLVPGPDLDARTAAALLGEDAEDPLDALVAASLVVPSAAGRYQMHDLIREYAASRAGDDADARTAEIRLLDFYLHSARAAGRQLDVASARLPLPDPAPGVTPVDPGSEGEALEWLDAERPNLVAAVLRVQDGPLARYAWQLADTLSGYFWGRGHGVEGLAMCEAALAAARRAGDARAEATVLDVIGLIHYNGSRYARAEGYHTEALAIGRRIGDLAGQATSLFNLGRVCSQVGRPEQTIRHHTEALALAERTGDRDAQALNINYLGVGYLSLGRPDTAFRHHVEALDLARELGDQTIMCRIYNGLGLAAWAKGDLRDAIKYHEESLALARRLGNRHGEGAALICLAETLCDLGEYEQAITAARTGAEQGRWTGERRHEVSGAEIIATARLRSGRTDGVVADLTEALRQAREIGFGYGEVSILVALSAACRTTGAPGQAVEHAEQALRRLRDSGIRALTARALTALGQAHLAAGDAQAAVRCLGNAVTAAKDAGQRLAEARARYALGLALRSAHGPAAARPEWTEALALFTDIGAPEADTVRELLTEKS